MKHWISIVSLSALLLLSLVGCADKDEQKKEARGTEASNSTNANDKKVTLKLLQNKIEITDKVKQMAAEYTKENPNVIIEATVSNEAEMQLKTSFASGNEPDIFTVKAFTDMTDWSSRLVDLSNEPWMSKVFPAAAEGMTVNGKKMGFPIAYEGYGFIYNMDLFKKAGIDRVPTTLTELRRANEKLKAAGIASYNEAYNVWWVLGQHLFNLPFAYERDPLDVIQRINKGETKVTDLASMDGFFDVLDMTVKYGSGGKGMHSLGVTYDNQVSDFATGKTAMMQQGVWTIDPIMKINPGIRIGMFAIPLSDNPEETKMPVGVPGYYVLNKNSKHVKESKEFLTWLHHNGQKYLVDSFKLIPAFSDLLTSEELGPLAADLSSYIEKKQTLPWAHSLWPSGANREFAAPLQKYIGGVINKEQALKDVQDIWDAQVKK